MARPALVILAAGLGSRFGGPKQLTPVGPGGDVIMDYSASGAVRAGFGHVVVVTRSEIERDISAHVRKRWPRAIEVTIVCQDADALARAAKGRSKPLGTAHAALVGIRTADTPYVGVVNADDLYGDEPYRLLIQRLAGKEQVWGALVTFPVAKTVIGASAVTRALCDVDDGRLRGIEEGTVHGATWVGRSGRHVTLGGSEPVSMNFWGFGADAAGPFEDATRRVVDSHDEALLPDVVRAQLAVDARVVALAYDGPCVGLTHPDDLYRVRAAVNAAAW